MSVSSPEATLYVRDLRRSARFYVDALKFTLDGCHTEDGRVIGTLNTEEDLTCVVLRLGGLIVNLQPAQTADLEPGSVVDHAVWVPQVDAVHAAARKQGASPSPLVDQPWGKREFTLIDEDGHVWTIFGTVSADHDQTAARQRGEITGYVSAEEFQRAAQEQNLTVQQYLDRIWASDKATLTDYSEGVFKEAARFGMFNRPLRRVVEIGTGVGMHVATVQRLCRPESYESYEPERGWADWLATEYGVLSHESDGVSLQQTATASVDLVHAHGVFVALLFLTAVQYFREMARVLRPGGYAFFDILSTECMGEEAIAAWLKSEWRWPVVLDKEFVKAFFLRQGFAWVGDFRLSAFDDSGECMTNYLIFRKLDV